MNALIMKDDKFNELFGVAERSEPYVYTDIRNK